MMRSMYIGIYNKQLHPELTGNKQMYDSENYSILELD
nr:MAG TPA: hypothetical protein [Caudoviricetes sp.]